MEFITADLVDAYDDVLRSCDAQFKQYGARTRFHGPVRTIKSFEDNTLIKQALAEAGEGAVLVIDGGASLRCSLLGDFMAAMGEKNGWAGLVVWGAIRDAVPLGALSLGIKALGSNPKKSTKTGAGQRDVPVSFGGVTFQPGDWLYSDEDGIVVCNRSLEAPAPATPMTAMRQHL